MIAGRYIFPTSGRQLLDGGLDNKFQKAIIDDNESPDCLNVVFDQGGVETRYGATKLNATLMASAAVDGLYTRRDRTSSETMIAFCNGLGYTLGTTTFLTIGSAQSVFTAGQRVCGTNYENHIFLCTGGTIPYKYNGTDFTRHGVYPPTTTHTVATAATGTVLTGDYRYKVTYVNTQLVESDLGPVNTTITVTGQNVALAAIPTAPQSFGVGSRYIYRTTNGGSTYKRLATLNNNTTTTYEDGIADASLGVNAPTDNGVPPNYKAVLAHKDRIFCITGVDNKLYFSGWGEPYTFGSLDYLLIGDDAGDIPQGLGVHNDMLVITGEKNHYFLYMADSSDAATWQVHTGQGGLGSKSRFGLANFDNKMLMPAVENGIFVGMAIVSGLGLEKSITFLTVNTAGSALESDRIEPDMFLVQSGYIDRISAITFKNKIWIAVTYGASQTTNNRIYQYDYNIDNLTKKQRGSWSPFTGTPMHISQFTIYDGKIYGGTSDATGFVYRLDDGTYSDSGSAIDSYYWTKDFGGNPGDLNYHKDFRNAYVLVKNAGTYYMNLIYRVDSDSGDGNTVQINLDPGGSQWGVMEWGTDEWGGGNSETEVKVDLATASGKRIQFKFTNQNKVNQMFRVAGLSFRYNKKGLR